MVLEQEIIDMLIESKEIQNKREFILGNMYYDRYEGNLNIIGLRYRNYKTFTSFNYPLRNDKKGYIWIPSQKQLQDIYYRKCHYIMFKELNQDYNKLEITLISLASLQEFVSVMAKFNIFFINYYELWIAFIMHELYNKVWSNNKWELFKYTKPSKKRKNE